MNNKKPFYWVPSLYLGEALPFSAVMLISVIMFKEFGLSDGQITVYTGWMGLPYHRQPQDKTVVDCIHAVPYGHSTGHGRFHAAHIV